MVTDSKILFWLMTFCLFQSTLSDSLWDLVLSNVKCDCERSTDLNVSDIKIHWYNYEYGSFDSWYLIDSAAESITKREDFDPQQCIAIYVTGYTNTVEGRPVEMTKCALSRATCSDGKKPLLLVVDHSAYTTASNLLDTIQVISFYKESTKYSKSIGYSVGKFLVNFLEKVDRSNLFLVGHSMGSHIAGHAAEYVKATTENKLSTLYSIDAAAPCFEDCPNEHIRSGLAEKVIAFHCDSGEQGSALNIADYDFYAGDGKAQELCPPAGWDLLYARSTGSCSHNACVAIALSPSFLETDWTATKCVDYESYSSGLCSANETTNEVGFMKIPSTSAGVYYFTPDTELECYIEP